MYNENDNNNDNNDNDNGNYLYPQEEPSYKQESFFESEPSIISQNNEDLSAASNKQNIQTILDSLSENTFICEKCFSTPYILFNKNDINKLYYFCNCKKGIENLTNKSINNINKNYIKIESKKDIKFLCYCAKCHKDLTTENDNDHKSHENLLLYFNKYISEDDIKNIWELLLNSNNNNNNNYKQMNTDGKLDMLIKIIVDNYENNPNYILFNNIWNILNFFKIKINSENELEEYKNKNKNKIIENNTYQESTIEEIKIIQIVQSYFNDLKKLDSPELNLINLIELILENNNIDDISPLLKINLINLEKLSFKMNKIGDNMIDCIKELHLPKLKNFILENNNFTNFEFFHAIEHFKNLEDLDISSNPFEENIDKIYSKNIYYILNSIKIINFSNGVFNDETIKLLFQFKLDNVEKIILKGNYLNILTFIKIILFLDTSELNWPNIYFLDLKKNNIINIDEEIEGLNIEEIEQFTKLYRDLEWKNKIKNLTVELIDNNDNIKDILRKIDVKLKNI